MANAKITALTSLTAATTDDVLPIVDDPSGSPVTKKITVAALFGSIGAPTSYMAASSIIRVGSTAAVTIAVGNTSASGSGTGAVLGLYSDDGAAMASGDRLGGFLFGGSSSGAAVRNAAAVFGYAAAAWSDGSSYPTYLTFETTATSATTRTERLRIDNAGDFTFFDGADFILGTSTGTKFGTATTQKIGFFNATPIVQGTAFTQTYSTASHTHAAITASNPPAGGTGATAGAYDTAANRNLMITSLTNNIADVANVKQVLNGLIDDLQALGLVA